MAARTEPAPLPPARSADVVIVGAGPVGLLLAGDLARSGVDVLVLEERTEPITESRASTVHTRTMDLLAARDLLGELGPPAGGPGHFGGLRLELTAADPEHPYAGQWKAPQTSLEAVLGRRAQRHGAVVWRGCRVIDVVPGDGGDGTAEGHVDVAAVAADGRSMAVRGGFVVGCDGESSTVRAAAGFAFPGEDATKELFRADVDGIEIPNRRFERRENGLAIAARNPEGVTRVMVHVRGRRPEPRTTAPEFAEVAQAWWDVTGEDITHGRPLWVNAFGNARRQADRYRRGRVLLAGDAAHIQLPVGGQALNLGLQDAAELSWRLAAQFGEPPDDGTSTEPLGAADREELLEGYHAVRHPIGRRTLTNIAAQSELLLGGPEVDALRTVLGELLDMPPVRRHLATMISAVDTPLPPVPQPRTNRPDPARPTPVRPGTHSQSRRRHRPAAAAIPTRRKATMDLLAGKTALVTGSSRSIGRATAIRLAREGALVAVHYASNEQAADETVAAIEADGGRAFTLQAELGAPGDVHELFLGLEAGLKERTGSTDLNILVNNAGIMGGVAPEDVTPELFDRLYAVNARAPFFIVQRGLQNMPDGGRIINISSGLTRFANPQEVAYAMTKGAVDQLTLHYAKHLGPRGITVNSVGPGITRNDSPVFGIPEAVQQMGAMSVFNRVGETDDIAAVVAFLAQDEARWITGSYLDASGGTLLGGQ
ncbi:monooxygenase [Saccharomonospora sp. CUA-673]|uniref:SDR family oxidoreductase n=1 Tax=Saccharomonospora sp. CUA-673 TaxID=1904969 RepID=UPI00095CE122|nr:SDR family oxidoreductase [Saccharomonospora sp. CUA-673]OLT48986.1 monooxygenase [Saccharomonospora sp. CUA-673]